MLTHECKGNASYKHLSIKQENIDLYYKNKPRIFATVPVDPISMKLLLSGKSYDYGKPKWNFVTGKLYVPKDYAGLQIEYDGDSFVDYVNLSSAFEVAYY